MLAEAEKASRPVSFHQIFPAAGQAVVDRTIVPGAFTKSGWVFMQNAFKNPSQFFSGEQWVMGAQGATGVDAATIEQLRKRYQDEYIQHWRDFIKGASVLRYASLRDANEKLKILSGPQSPLLQLFSLVSKNTAVGVPEVDGMFRAAQSVVPPPGDVPASPANQPYMTGLVGLQKRISLELRMSRQRRRSCRRSNQRKAKSARWLLLSATIRKPALCGNCSRLPSQTSTRCCAAWVRKR
jgi:type VI secretion system protein ImpL